MSEVAPSTADRRTDTREAGDDPCASSSTARGWPHEVALREVLAGAKRGCRARGDARSRRAAASLDPLATFAACTRRSPRWDRLGKRYGKASAERQIGPAEVSPPGRAGGPALCNGASAGESAVDRTSRLIGAIAVAPLHPAGTSGLRRYPPAEIRPAPTATYTVTRRPLTRARATSVSWCRRGSTRRNWLRDGKPRRRRRPRLRERCGGGRAVPGPERQLGWRGRVGRRRGRQGKTKLPGPFGGVLFGYAAPNGASHQGHRILAAALTESDKLGPARVPGTRRRNREGPSPTVHHILSSDMATRSWFAESVRLDGGPGLRDSND